MSYLGSAFTNSPDIAFYRPGHKPTNCVSLASHVFRNFRHRGSVLALEHRDHLSLLAALARRASFRFGTSRNRSPRERGPTVAQRRLPCARCLLSQSRVAAFCLLLLQSPQFTRLINQPAAQPLRGRIARIAPSIAVISLRARAIASGPLASAGSFPCFICAPPFLPDLFERSAICLGPRLLAGQMLAALDDDIQVLSV